MKKRLLFVVILIISIFSIFISTEVYAQFCASYCSGGSCNDVCEVEEDNGFCPDCTSATHTDGTCDPGLGEDCSTYPNECGQCIGGSCSVDGDCASNLYCGCSGTCVDTAPACCPATAATDCDDSLACTTDTCSAGSCSYAPKTCPANQVCNPTTGDCVCGAGYTYCSGNCVNLQTDLNNCGTCGNVCTSGSCVSGSCTPACPSPCTLGAKKCSGTGYQTCISSGGCNVWSSTITSCVDSNPCTADSCSGGSCVNQPTAGASCGTQSCASGSTGTSCTRTCSALGACQSCTPACIETSCSDGTDNDVDTKTDCADPDCASAANCVAPVTSETNCADSIDNDGDGKTDCADPDCTSSYIINPCAGITCNTPPNSLCYLIPGLCSGGFCSYSQLSPGASCGTGQVCTSGAECVDCITGNSKPCLNQNGVCSGSQQTCASNTWPGCNYASYSQYYQIQESSCSDSRDNDCDTYTDCADPDCSGT